MENTSTNPQKTTTRMERPNEDRVLGGVAAAIAQQTGISVGLIRLGFVITAMFGGLGVALYAAAWALLPGEGEQETAAERWLRGLTTPGQRLGAFLIGAAVVMLLSGIHHTAAVAALVVIGAAAVLSDTSTQIHQPMSAGNTGNETE